jgi:SAM-dependent methyltransferase
VSDLDTTSRAALAGSAYRDERHLAARQSLYRWQQPTYDLPGMVLDHLPTGGGVVLDVGCGNGRYVTRIRAQRPDLTVVGLDISAGILAHVAPPVAVADAAALPVADRWAAAAAEVLGVERGPRRVSLSSRFPLDDAPAMLRPYFADVEVVELVGAITVREPEPVIAHLASYRTWADTAGVPFDATLECARRLLDSVIDRDGEFRISCRSGLLFCHGPR